MVNNDNKEYNSSLSKRFKLILELCDLEVSGFAQLTGRSESHIYGIINGSRRLSSSFASKIGTILDFESMKIFDLNKSLPITFDSINLIDFRRKHQANSEYFISKRKEKSIDYFIVNILIPSTYLKNQRSVAEIRSYSREVYKKEFSSEELSKGLTYAVKKGLLKVLKKKIIRFNGTIGKRTIDFFYV